MISERAQTYIEEMIAAGKLTADSPLLVAATLTTCGFRLEVPQLSDVFMGVMLGIAVAGSDPEVAQALRGMHVQETMQSGDYTAVAGPVIETLRYLLARFNKLPSEGASRDQ